MDYHGIFHEYSVHPDIHGFYIILDSRSQRAGSYKIGAVIVNVYSVS